MELLGGNKIKTRNMSVDKLSVSVLTDELIKKITCVYMMDVTLSEISPV